MFLIFSFVDIRSFGSVSLLEKRHLVANSALLFPCGYLHGWNLDQAHLCIRLTWPKRSRLFTYWWATVQPLMNVECGWFVVLALFYFFGSCNVLIFWLGYLCDQARQVNILVVANVIWPKIKKFHSSGGPHIHVQYRQLQFFYALSSLYGFGHQMNGLA